MCRLHLRNASVSLTSGFPNHELNVYPYAGKKHFLNLLNLIAPSSTTIHLLQNSMENVLKSRNRLDGMLEII